jgi:hypothetical protein
MFFTLKLLKLGLKLVLLPFRVVAKLLRFLVGFAVGRARGNTSVDADGDSHSDGSEGTPDPIREPTRENETPGESPGEATASADTTDTPVANAGANEGAILSSKQYAAVLGALVIGQLLGLLAYEANVDAVAGAIVDIRFVAATPLFDVIYWPLLGAGSTWLYGVVAVAYVGFYGWLGWRAFEGGAVPSELARPAAGIFAANAVAYAVTPLLYVNEIPFTSDYVGYYTSGGTLVQVVVYGALMGLLYVSTQRLVGWPTTPSAAPSDSATGTEPATWAEDDDTGSGATTAASEEIEDSLGADEAFAAEAQGEPSASEPAADSETTVAGTASVTGTAEGVEADSPDTDGEPTTEQPPDAATASVDGTRATESADREETADVAETADRKETVNVEETDGQTEEAEEAADVADTADVEDTAPGRAEPTEATNAAEAALGRLAADDTDSRLAAAGDLQELAAEAHDYLTGERVGEALDDEPEPDVRTALVDALAALDTDAATEALRDARFDPDPAVSDRATDHLD